MKMGENNDFIQLPPLKKDTPSDVVAFIWEYMKVQMCIRDSDIPVRVPYLIQMLPGDYTLRISDPRQSLPG